ncbi:protein NONRESPONDING TO OXYLIPINS 2, mitochondrial isoform X2 [Manihot esculenta]|uniref:protein NONRESPONDING TO OXYLIPINS 2, mitochondrial isoform X2 n=1 Tax=Manihot esculenta TaxID=3983 RepID=UPI000B5D365C|nr:protein NONRESPONDING TO OXYLIPINS 2, mitochondrial isoform X2 [Manihot esculenta]
MAASCYRFMCRSSISSIKSAIRSNASKSPIARPPISPSSSPHSPSSSLRRFSFSYRTPSELGCVQSLLPLHSAVATSRMMSCLSTTSRSCRALSQEIGLSVPR